MIIFYFPSTAFPGAAYALTYSTFKTVPCSKTGQFVCSGVLVFFSAIEINLHQRPKSWLKAELKRILTVKWRLNGLEIGAEYYRIWIDVPIP